MVWATMSSMLSASPNVSTCLAANEAARSEHDEITRHKLLTKAVLCDVQPFCATEILFQHEFYDVSLELQMDPQMVLIDSSLSILSSTPNGKSMQK